MDNEWNKPISIFGYHYAAEIIHNWRYNRWTLQRKQSGAVDFAVFISQRLIKT